MMKTSQQGIDMVRHYESIHDGDLSQIGLQPKLCPAGVVTWGYGHTESYQGQQVKDIDLANRLFPQIATMTEAEAEVLLAKDLIKEEAKIRRSITVPLLQHQYDALVSYFYNIGYSETMAQLINTKSTPKQITDWFVNHYIKGDGKILRGLVYRRQSEAHLFNTGELKFFN